MNMFIFVVAVGLLIYLYSQREMEETNLGWKLIGYYILGVSSIFFGNFSIPLGFIIFLAFLKPKVNKRVKSYAAYLGLAMFLIGVITPFIQEKYYEYPRTIEVSGSNINDFEFDGNWQTIQQEFGFHFLSIQDLLIEYTREGTIKKMKISGTDKNAGDYQVFYDVKFGDGEFVVRRFRQERSQDIYFGNEMDLTTVSNVMKLLDEADFTDMMPGGDTERYTLRSDMGRTRYAVESNEKYRVDGTGVTKILNEQLPVLGFVTTVCGGRDCNPHVDYIFDAKLNADEEGSSD